MARSTASMASSPPGYKSLQRGLEILHLIQQKGRMRMADISTQLGMPLSTVYRYAAVLRESGFALEIDGYLVPSNRLAESGETSPHLVRYAAPVLRRMREETEMTALLAVRVHITAVCLEVSYAHAQHRISFARGAIRSLYAGASALPLLAYAPPKIVRELLSSDLRSYTTATLTPEMIGPYLRQVRAEGYAVSYGQITPGMIAVGVPVLVNGSCLCSLSLVGDEKTKKLPLEDIVRVLQQGAAELLLQLPQNVEEEVWLDPNE